VPTESEVDRLWGIIRTIMAERDAYATERDRLAAQLQALEEGGAEVPVLPAAGLAAAFRRAFPHCAHEQRLALFETMLTGFAAYMRDNGRFAREAHALAEREGVTLALLDYYSPIARRAEIEAQGWRILSTPLAAEKFDAAAQAARLHALLPHMAELADIPMEAPEEGGFHWRNGMFGPQDAATYHALIRAERPARVLEVGSGYSTLIAARAAALNGTTEVTCIEPYPTAAHNRHLRAQAGFRLVEAPAQAAGLGLFTGLGAGDILFIDSSHVVKPGSDVEFLFLEVLPRLAPGVLVHVHDIFLPRGYPAHYYIEQMRHWNENPMLAALLLENPRWRVEIANAFVADFGRSPALDRVVEALAGGDAARRAALAPLAGGGSLWLRRLPG